MFEGLKTLNFNKIQIFCWMSDLAIRIFSDQILLNYLTILISPITAEHGRDNWKTHVCQFALNNMVLIMECSQRWGRQGFRGGVEMSIVQAPGEFVRVALVQGNCGG